MARQNIFLQGGGLSLVDGGGGDNPFLQGGELSLVDEAREPEFAPQPAQLDESGLEPVPGTSELRRAIVPQDTTEEGSFLGSLKEGAIAFGKGTINALAMPEAVSVQFALGLLGHQPAERSQAIVRIMEQRPEEGDIVFLDELMEIGFGITDEKLDEFVRPVLGKAGLSQTMNAVELFSLAASIMTGSALTKWIIRMGKATNPAKVMKEGFQKIVNEKKQLRKFKQASRDIDKEVQVQIAGVKEGEDAFATVGKLRRERRVQEAFDKAVDELNKSVPKSKKTTQELVDKQVAKQSIRIEAVSKKIEDVAKETQLNKLIHEQQFDELSTLRGGVDESVRGVIGREIVEEIPTVRPKVQPKEIAQAGVSKSKLQKKIAKKKVKPVKTAVLKKVETESISSKAERLKKEAQIKSKAAFESRKEFEARKIKKSETVVVTPKSKLQKKITEKKIKKPLITDKTAIGKRLDIKGKAGEKAKAKKDKTKTIINLNEKFELPKVTEAQVAARAKELKGQGKSKTTIKIQLTQGTGKGVSVRKELLEKTIKEIQNTETKKFTIAQLATLWKQSPDTGRAIAESISDAGKSIYTAKVVNFARKRLGERGSIGFVSKSKLGKTGDPLADSAITKLNSMNESTLLKEKKNAQSVLASVNRVTVDVSGNFKNKLDKLGVEGQKTKMAHDLTLGSNNKSALEANEAFDRIYGVPLLKRGVRKVFGDKSTFSRFTREVQKRFDQYIIAKRHIEILETKKSFRLPGKVTKKELQALVNTVENGTDEVSKQIIKSSKEYWKTLDGLIAELRAEGLLSKEALIALRKSGRFYSPRQVIDWIDPIVAGRGKGGLSGTLSVRDSGVSKLSVEGTYRAIETDTQTLLNYAIQSTNKRIARNRANRALLDLAEKVPDNGVVKVVKFSEKTPQEHTVSVLVNGKQKGLKLSSEDYVEWIERDSKISADWANRVQKLSGARILKFMATGGNPEFAVSNLARDMAHIWLVTDEFSKALPIAAKQMLGDMGSVFTDAVRRKGQYIDFIKQGGGMSFMTHQGRLTEKVTGLWGGLQEVASYMGETSEILTRLALRKRTLKNLIETHKKEFGRAMSATELAQAELHATWTARNFLDFSQGGSFIKAADNAVPYLNASIQGTRGLFRAAKPKIGTTGIARFLPDKTFAAKASQIMGLSSGLYLANRFVNPKSLSQTNEQDRKNNFIIPMGDFFSFDDKEGNKRYWHAKIPKDQGQRFFATLAENLTIKALGDDIEPVSVVESLGEALPNISGIMPPAFKAVVGYALDINFWTKENVWRGAHLDDPVEEINNYTHPAFTKGTKLIKSGTGGIINLSPSRLQDALSQVFARGNVYTDVMGLGWQAIGGEISEADRKIIGKEMFKRFPLIRKTYTLTDPFNADRKKTERDQARFNTKRTIVNRKFDKSVSRSVDEGDREALKKMVSIIKSSRNSKEVKRLLRRLKTHLQLKGLQEKRLWLKWSEMSPEPRAYNFVNKLRSASKEDKERLLKDLGKVKSVASKEFLRELGIMLKQEKKMGVK